MRDRTCIVTGGNAGIGKATVEGLARLGATVVIACRDAGRGQTALRQMTSDGIEMDLGVNHVGHFLLTDLLLPLLKRSAPARIVVVSSSMHTSGTIDFEDLTSEKSWRGAYPRSKLANMLFVRTLAKRLAGSGVVVNGLHPGVVATELARDFPAPIRLMARWFFKSPEQGARTSLYLATAPEAAEISGRYFVRSKEKQPGAAALDDGLAERLWTETERPVAGRDVGR